MPIVGFEATRSFTACQHHDPRFGVACEGHSCAPGLSSPHSLLQASWRTGAFGTGEGHPLVCLSAACAALRSQACLSVKLRGLQGWP